MRPDIKKIVKLLNTSYGKPPPLGRSPPIDELVRTVLSQNTSDKNSVPAFKALKRAFKSWDGLLGAKVGRIANIIRHAGLANIKARRIKEVLAEIERREGVLSLSSLARLGTKESLSYLESLKGVGPKTAACVLLFSFNRPVMPVDTHIFRVSRRLGLIGGNVDIKEAHMILSGMVTGAATAPKAPSARQELLSRNLIYDFHLGIIEHGRQTCRAQNPRCGFCVLYHMCKFKSRALFKERSKLDKKS